MYFTINKVVYDSTKISNLQAKIQPITKEISWFYIDITTSTITRRLTFDTLEHLQTAIDNIRNDFINETIKKEYSFEGVTGTFNDINQHTICTINQFYSVDMKHVTSIIEWSDSVQLEFVNGRVMNFKTPEHHTLKLLFDTYSVSHQCFSITVNNLEVVENNVLNISKDRVGVNNTTSFNEALNINHIGGGSISVEAGPGDLCVLPIDTFGNVIGN